jgi:thiol:disulfide interchange protein DsbD
LKRAVALLGAVLALESVAAEPVGEPLEPEVAFPATGRVVNDAKGSPHRVEVRFAILDGYYLYADRFKVEAPGLATGKLAVPTGAIKDDPFVGKSRILRKNVVLGLPLVGRPRSGEYTLTVIAQGCAENRVCYAPFPQAVRVAIP